MKVTGNSVNVRSKPSIEGNAIGSVKQDQKNIKLIKANGGWWKIAIFPPELEITKENFEEAEKNVKTGYAKDPYVTK